MAEFPADMKYLWCVTHWEYKDETYTLRDFFWNKWTDGDVRSPMGKVSAEHKEKIEEEGSWLRGRVYGGGGSCGNTWTEC